MYKTKNPLLALPEELVAQINQVTEPQLDELILLVFRRFNQLRPDMESVFLSLPQDPQERDEELKRAIQFLRLPRA